MPLPVTIVRDDWDWLIVWCTVGATGLAALAIWFAVVSVRRADRIAREGRQAIVRERRNVFELGIEVVPVTMELQAQSSWAWTPGTFS